MVNEIDLKDMLYDTGNEDMEYLRAYFNSYEISSPIVSENGKYVIIHELMDESRKNFVLNSVLYRPDNGTFMFVDTGNDIYLEYGDFEQVKQYMSREEIDKFEKVRQEVQQDKEMAEAWYGRHRIGRETDLQQPGGIWTETHEALREYGPDEFGDPIRLISDDEMER